MSILMNAVVNLLWVCARGRDFTCVGDFLSCRLGLTLRKPLAARDELLASPFLRPSVALRERHASGDIVNIVNMTHCLSTGCMFLLFYHSVFHSAAYQQPSEYSLTHWKATNQSVCSLKVTKTYPGLMSENHSLWNREDNARDKSY